MAKILIVDDDPLLVRLYEKAFRLAKYETETAFNGEEALNKLKSMPSKPTLILLDVMMPKVNGLELLSKIKENPDLKELPVIMLTNLAGDKDAEEALLRGAITYMVKSKYQPKEVVLKVKEIMSGYAANEKTIPAVQVATKDIK
ncbi:MAG: response regulator [Candidatus Brennerbacteria bacterium]|nr:response regulator [Candidatus Brennerbacteria bacterium]